MGWLFILVTACGVPPEVQQELDAAHTELETCRAEAERTAREREALAARVERLQDELTDLKRKHSLERLGLKPGQDLVAVLETTKGTIRCRLFPDAAPLTVANFVELAEGRRTWTDPRTGKPTDRPLYDGTIFHRVIPGFMIQGGDPLGTGRGGPGYRFEDETDSGLTFDQPGLLAMANAGPNTNGSQFFITTGTPHHLDGKHTIFGRCAPLDVVEAISRVPRDRHDRPLEDVVLRKVRIERVPARDEE